MPSSSRIYARILSAWLIGSAYIALLSDQQKLGTACCSRLNWNSRRYVNKYCFWAWAMCRWHVARDNVHGSSIPVFGLVQQSEGCCGWMSTKKHCHSARDIWRPQYGVLFVARSSISLTVGYRLQSMETLAPRRRGYEGRR